jgi:hypothetical protein
MVILTVGTQPATAWLLRTARERINRWRNIVGRADFGWGSSEPERASRRLSLGHL